MIAFTGKMSDKCQDYIFNYEGKSVRITTSIISLILYIPFFILSITDDWIWAICIIPVILLIALSGIRPSKKDYSLAIPDRITIKNGKLTSKSDRFEISTTMSRVKKVIDFGDFYHIQISYPIGNARFLCEKRLLTDGTLKDFEALFKNKLIRKTYGKAENGGSSSN